MQSEAARPKGRSFDDEPTSQPMRPAARGQIARNPSTDQKRVRRENARKVAEWTPGHVKCQSCGVEAHPRMGDTAPECSVCGSYSISKTRPEVQTGGQHYPQNSRHLNQSDYSRQAARHDQCGYCGVENASVKDGLCPQHEGHRNDGWEGQSNSDEATWDPRTATVIDTRAEMLNPGDQIKTPNGRTQKVVRVRPHETSGKHVYVDTDGGTAVVERSAGFQVAPKNSQQQSLPGYGTPGGNANALPFDPQSGNATNAAPSTQCPTCGGHGTLARQGDHYSCNRCGYREQFGGAGGHAFSDASSVVRTFSTVNQSTKSVVARRAAALLNQEDYQ